MFASLFFGIFQSFSIFYRAALQPRFPTSLRVYFPALSSSCAHEINQTQDGLPMLHYYKGTGE
jgi:hypothetical protein